MTASDSSKSWWKAVKSIIGLNAKDPAVEKFIKNMYNGDSVTWIPKRMQWDSNIGQQRPASHFTD